MTSPESLITNPIVERAFKTAVETGIATAATTTVYSTSTLEKAAVTALATFLSLVWNGVQTSLATRKTTKLANLQLAINQAVAAVEASKADAARASAAATASAA